MPIYEYRCKKGHTFEVMQRISDDPVATCEVCGAPVARVLHPVAVHFKGSGFYNTDYGTRKRSREMKDGKGEGKSGDSKSSADSSSSSESGSGSGSDSSKKDSGDSKPAAKASAGG
ncbi:MAG: FmdB family zinc ribbon protein [Solirubrobacteraceae bacterium]